MKQSLFSRITRAGLGAALLAPAALAGEPGLSIIFVTDPDLDQVYTLNDLSHDGSYNELGDTLVLYQDTLGTVTLSDPACITISTDDTIYVGDAVENLILALNDYDENGDCYAPGEHWIYIDSTNASGVSVSNVTGLSTRLLGTVWASNQGSGVGGDSILRMKDLNADGDANDAGEAVVYYAPAPGAAEGDSRPTSVFVDKTGTLYYLENGSTGALAKGVYQLADLNFNGLIEAPAEVSPFFIPSAQAFTADLTNLDRDGNGDWFVNDRANRIVWRGRDVNSDGTIDPGTEASIFWTGATGSNVRDFAVADNGSIYVGESLSPDRVFRGFDLNSSGAIDTSEQGEAYSDAISPENIDNPSGVTRDFHDHQDIGIAYCFGNVGCPCGNNTSEDTGCENHLGHGALLEAEGSDGIGNNDAEFIMAGTPPFVFSIMFQGTTDAGPFGTVAFDGLNCLGGSLTRMGTRFADSTGSATWGPGLATPLGWVAGQTRYFQARYRNALGPCHTGLNLTNGLMITFTP